MEHVSLAKDSDLDQINKHLAHTSRDLPLSQLATVWDPKRKSFSRVCVRRINSDGNDEVVKFSEPQYVPILGKCLKLATPAYYRAGEHLSSGIRDPEDGTLLMNATPYLSKVVQADLPPGMVRNFSARMTLSSGNGAWVYCTSNRPNSIIEYQKLKKRFFDENDYSAVTKIKDPDAFALRLGLDIALMDDLSEYVKLDGLAMLINAIDGDAVDRIVHVHHGPVIYEDQSGVLRDQKDFGGPGGGICATFTKRTKFQYQAEYRFAVSPLGVPKQNKLMLPVSKELCRIVVPES